MQYTYNYMEHLLVVALTIFALAGAWVVRRAGMTTHLSISLHAAKTRVSRGVFGVLVLLATVLMAVQLYGWLLPHYGSGSVMYILFGLVIVCLSTAALVPHIERTWREIVHNSVAWGIVYVIPLVMACMLQWSLSSFAWWLVVCAVAVNSALLMIALLWYQRCRPWFLYFQTAYLAVFFGSLLIVTYC